MGLCKTRQKGAGKTASNTSETVLFSDYVEGNANHSEGLALMLSKQAEKGLI